MNWKSQDENTLKFNPNELEISRKYIWDEKNHKRLMEFIGARDSIKVLDVGCGTGYIIRQVAKASQNSELYGLDIAQELLDHASILATSENSNITFLKGSIYDIPFPDNYFDLVTGQFVLLNIDSPEVTIKEIFRVLKPTGKFVSIEPPTNTRIIYDSHVPEEIIKIEHLVNESITKKWANSGIDKNIGLRIPELLNKQGFKNIDIEGYFNIKLGSYPYTLEGIVERSTSLLQMMERQERRLSDLVKDGVLTIEQKNAYMKFHRDKRTNIIQNPEIALNDMSIHGSLCLMACGYK